MFGRNIHGRLDLTPGRAYTLSRATRDLVRNLDDIVTIKLFASDELPAPVEMQRRDIDDVLRDYRGAGNGMVRVIVQDPASDSTVAEEVRSLGIPPVQFNVVGESQLTVRDGYLGIAIFYADQQKTIPFVQRTDDLEYRLSTHIRAMTVSDRATVAIYTAPPAPDAQGPRAFNALRRGVQETHTARTLTLPADDQPAADVDVVVLIGAPDSLPDDQMDRLRAFLERGGSAFILADGMSLPGQSEFVVPRPVLWNELLEPYGVAIRSDMVYDLISNETAQIPSRFGMMLAPYPLWVRGMSTRSGVINSDLQTVFMPWPSSLDTTGAAAGTVTPLFVTSEAAGLDSMMSMLAPRRQFSRQGLETRILAAMVNPLVGEESDGPTGRVVVVGNTDVLQDRFLQGNPTNLAFGLNVVDWLTQDESLIGIRAKNRAPPSLAFSSEAKQDFVKHANVIGVPVLLILLGVLRMLKRRRKTQQRYQRVTVSEAVA